MEKEFLPSRGGPTRSTLCRIISFSTAEAAMEVRGNSNLSYPFSFFRHYLIAIEEKRIAYIE